MDRDEVSNTKMNQNNDRIGVSPSWIKQGDKSQSRLKIQDKRGTNQALGLQKKKSRKSGK